MCIFLNLLVLYALVVFLYIFFTKKMYSHIVGYIGVTKAKAKAKVEAKDNGQGQRQGQSQGQS